jgi:hypothetical protein
MSNHKHTLDTFSLPPPSTFGRSRPGRPRQQKPQPQPEPEPRPQPQLPITILLPSGNIPIIDEPLPVTPSSSTRDGATKAHSVPRALLEEFVLSNPHCRQVDTDLVRSHFAGADAFDLRPLSELPTVIAPSSPVIPFVERPDKDRSPLHYGQIKLFLSELDLLTTYTAACDGAELTVVYAGAAPGHHISFLAGCFPSCRFLLYDPAPFCKALAEAPPSNVTVNHGAFFTLEVAAALAETHDPGSLVFVSDIRTGLEEAYVDEDMARQKAWVRALRPLVSMVKFRLPWQPGTTEYLDGEIRLPAYAPLTSTECRLVTTQGLALLPDRAYDNQAYERACAYHNTVGRVRAYAHDVELEGLDHCHDCSTFVRLVGAYLRRTGQSDGAADVGRFMRRVFQSLGTGRTLASEYSRSSNRSAKSFPKRSYKDDVLVVSKESRGVGTRGRDKRRDRGCGGSAAQDRS